MKKNFSIATMMLAGALMLGACANKGEQKTDANVNENPQEEKVEVKNVEGRKNFNDVAVITPHGPKHICFNLSAHKTTENIRLKKAFTVSFATKGDIVQSDYFGIVSANDVPDKVKKAGFTVTKSPNVDAPIVNEYKLTLECKVVKMEEDDKGGARVVGEVINMSADESILDAEGKIDLGKLQPVIFDSSKNTYRVVGEKVGDAWGSGKAIQEAEVK